MRVCNPQWQGSGTDDSIRIGAETLASLYQADYMLSLSDAPLSEQNGILDYQPLLEQTHNFRQLLQKEAPDRVFTFGGDCGIEIIPVSYINKISNGLLGVIWLDAHADLNTPESSPSKTFHGMPARHLLGEGDQDFLHQQFSCIRPEQLVLTGVRDCDSDEREWIADRGLCHFPHINYPAIRQYLYEQGFEKIYIHLDADVFSPEVFSHVKCPVPHGLSISDVQTLIQQLQDDFTLVGSSITEITANKADDLSPLTPVLSSLLRSY